VPEVLVPGRPLLASTDVLHPAMPKTAVSAKPCALNAINRGFIEVKLPRDGFLLRP